MKYDASFFTALASLSEVTLMSAVVELANKGDMPAMHGFMDFIEALPPASDLPILSGCKTISLMVKARGALDADPNDGLDDEEEQSFAKALVSPLVVYPRKQLAISERTNFSPQDADAWTPEKRAYLDRVLKVAGTQAEKETWLTAVGFAVAEGINSHEAAQMLHASGVSFNKLDQTERFACIWENMSLTLIALDRGNLQFAAQAFQNMGTEEHVVTVDNLAFGGTIDHELFRQLHEGLFAHMDDVLSVLTVLDERVGLEKMAMVRTRLLTHHVQQHVQNNTSAFPAVLQAVIGASEPHQAVFKEFLTVRGTACYNLGQMSVRAHADTLLSWLQTTLSVDPYHSQAIGLTGIRTALGEESSLVDSLDKQERLRNTLSFLVQNGHDMKDVGEGLGAIHYLAKSGKAQDREAKLHVLLSLGIDPLAKDINGKVASAHLKKADRPAWDHVVHAFKARESSRALLQEIEDMAPEAAKKGTIKP